MRGDRVGAPAVFAWASLAAAAAAAQPPPGGGAPPTSPSPAPVASPDPSPPEAAPSHGTGAPASPAEPRPIDVIAGKELVIHSVLPPVQNDDLAGQIVEQGQKLREAEEKSKTAREELQKLKDELETLRDQKKKDAKEKEVEQKAAEAKAQADQVAREKRLAENLRDEAEGRREIEEVLRHGRDAQVRVEAGLALLRAHRKDRFLTRSEALAKIASVTEDMLRLREAWRRTEELAKKRAATIDPLLEDQALSPERRGELEQQKKYWSDALASTKDPRESATYSSDPTLEFRNSVAESSQLSPTSLSDGKSLTFRGGSHLSYGLTVSLLRFSNSRRANEPARMRNYEPSLELLPAEFGFQFTYHSAQRPWRLSTEDGGEFQLVSAGGILLARIDNDDFERGNLSLAGTVTWFDDSIGLGLGVDLYRGIPVLGPDDRSSGETAHTGVLAWATSARGELTPENVFFVVTLNLAGLAKAVEGKVGE